jgi:hypothetical protein
VTPRGIRRRVVSDETGMSMVLVSAGFMAFFAATTLAIDVGMFMAARSQAQNSADASALAGAVAFVYDSFNDRSAGGPAVQSAINTALLNKVVGADVAIAPTDVAFPIGTNGEFNRVQVTVFRTANRTNPVPTLIGPVFGVNTIDISATATAEAAPANAMSCVKPFTIPDRWIERGSPPWTPNSTFDRYDHKGNLLQNNPDEYILPDQPGYVGYNPDTDKGTMLMIRAGTGNNVSPSFYWSWAMPGGTGASFYEDNIANCHQATFTYLSTMTQEPGNMVGPTMQGVDALIAKDSGAYWDTAAQQVKSTYNPSPRVFPIPLYDPEYYQSGTTTGRNVTLRMANWVGFFLEYRQGNDIYGRIVPITGVIDDTAGPAPAGSYARAIRLVE